MRWLSARRDPSPAAITRQRRLKRWTRRSAFITVTGVGLIAVTAGGIWAERSGAIVGTREAVARSLLSWTVKLGFTLANVEVEGRQRSPREAILAALDIARGMPIFSVDPAAAKRRLETLPWVRSASVERRLPDTLYIRLVERQPLALWQRQGKHVLVDRDGAVIAGERIDQFGNLVILVGEDAPAKGAALLDMLATEPAIASQVTAAVRVGGRRWTLHLKGGIEVALPEEEPESAWHRLAQLERSDGLLERDIELVDLRLPDRLVVRTGADIQKPAAKKSRQPGKTT